MKESRSWNTGVRSEKLEVRSLKYSLFMPYALHLIFIFFLLLYTSSIHAQQGVTLEAFVDRPHVTLDDQVVLTVRVSGGNVFTEPSIPNRGNFEVLSRGSASNVQMINGRLAVSKEFTYVLQPLKAGQFEIGPISIFIEGVEKQTAPISVTVGEAENSQPGHLPQNSQKPSLPQGAFPPGTFPSPPMTGLSPFGASPSAPDEGQYKDIFVTAEVDNKSPYKGEQIIYTFRLYTSKGVGEAKLNLPDFHDFWSEEVQKENKYYKELGGKRYVVSEFKVILFPTKSGALNIAPAELKAQVEEALNFPSAFNDPFFTMRGAPLSYRPRVLRSSEIHLEVKDLPAGAPAGFTGLVGQFGVQSNISKTELAVGDSATLAIQISGVGNIKDAQLQNTFQIPGLKIYEDKPVQEIKKSQNGISGSKTFKIALVPENPGKFKIPPLHISYFDPQKGSYENLETPEYELSVVPGTSTEKLNKAQGVTSVTNAEDSSVEDIATIHTPSQLKQQSYSFDFYYWIVILFVAPPLIFLIAFLVSKRQRWVETHSDVLKKRKGFSRATERIKSLDLSKSDELSGHVSHILKDYLGDKFNLVGAALTPVEAEQLLLKKGEKHPAGLAMVEFLRELDAWIYGAPPLQKGWEKETQKKAIHILKAVEKEIF